MTVDGNAIEGNRSLWMQPKKEVHVKVIMG